MKSIYIIWQDPTKESRMWNPVAKLTRTKENRYIFNYTNGAKHKKFSPFPRMLKLEDVYHSEELFPFFKNRIIPENRPEFLEMLDWVGLKRENLDLLDLLSISGGSRGTDNFRIINIPKIEDGYYIQKFFVSGISHCTDQEKENIKNFSQNEKLCIKLEDNNPHDKNAIMLLRTTDGKKVGYYPHYLNVDLRKIISMESECHEKACDITVDKVNLTAPEQYRLLCTLKIKWPDGFIPFESNEYNNYSN